MKQNKILKLTAVVLTLVTALSLAACSGAGVNTPQIGNSAGVNTDIHLSRIRSAKNTPDPQTTEPSSPQETFITMEQAKQQVLAYLGIEEAVFTELDADPEDLEYELEAKVDGTEYEFDVHAVTGDVRMTDRDVLPVQTMPAATAPAPAADTAATETVPAAQESTLLTQEQIKALVLEHFGVSEAEFLKVAYDRDDREYDVLVNVDGTLYELELNAYTGRVREKEQESRPAAQTSQSTGNDASSLLTLDQAKEAVCSYFQSSDIRFLEYELDDGAYEFEILYGGREYDVEVNAGTGNIREVDRDD